MKMLIWVLVVSLTLDSLGAEPVVLSEEGSGRATGYAEANKIVTWEGKTHAAWLDSPEEGFQVRVATLNRETGVWSAPMTVGQAYDNHGGPALTVDSKGYLHIVYYPHHQAFRYRRSKRPNDASEWEDEQQFGEELTYPTLLCGADDMLYFTARRRHRDRPYEVELWTKKEGGEWERNGHFSGRDTRDIRTSRSPWPGGRIIVRCTWRVVFTKSPTRRLTGGFRPWHIW